MNLHRAIILTALQKEYLAVRGHLINLKEETHRGTVYELGGFSANGRSWEVAITEVGRHSENASFEAKRAISHFNPEVAIFVGVAGGLHGVALGDVVAATKVYGYKAGKADAEFLPAPEVYRSSHTMEQRAKVVARNEDWLKRIQGPIRNPLPSAFVEPIAAGPEVVKSTRSSTYQFLRSNYSDALAVEMEGLGFLAAARANQDVYALVVRGISDLIEHKEEADAGGSQQIASENASAFCFEILATLDFGEEVHSSTAKIENIPYLRNRNFAGRISLLNNLHAYLASGKYAVVAQSIAGLGGVGKSQLALEYTYRYLSDYSVIWWVRAEEPSTLIADYAELAVDLAPHDKAFDDLNIQIKFIKRWLENNPGWLLVFDNAANPGELDKYLPKIGSGHVIITSRNPNWESLARVLEISEFERSESIEFMFNRTGQRDSKAADALAEAMGDLPLALEQAGAYIKETGISLNDYLERFQKRRAEILKLGKPANIPKPLSLLGIYL